MFSSAANRSASAFASCEHPRERSRVEMTLVEQLLGRLDHRGDDSRLRDDAARGADGAAADLARDVTDRQRELRRACERVAPLVHRRRAGVRRLAPPGDARALDAERPEHDPERQVHRLQHRALLDVELEIGGCAFELRPRIERAVEVDAVLAQRVGQRDPIAVGERTQLVLVAHRAGGRATSRRASGRSALPPRRPSSRAAPSPAACLPRRSGAAPRRRATTFRQPSSQPPFGTESRCPPITSARRTRRAA